MAAIRVWTEETVRIVGHFCEDRGREASAPLKVRPTMVEQEFTVQLELCIGE